MIPATVRAGIVLLEGDRLALIERRRGDELYYVLPGGSVDNGESPVEAAKREASEELGLDVDVGALLAEVTVVRSGGVSRQLHYRATTAGGTFGTGTGQEFSPAPDEDLGTYRAVWRCLDACHLLDVRPRALVDAILVGGIDRLCESPLAIHEHKDG